MSEAFTLVRSSQSMAFFADLTPHTYTSTGTLEILNVGWLDEGRPFAVGPTSKNFGMPSWNCANDRSFFTGVFMFVGTVKVSGKTLWAMGRFVMSRKEIWYSAPTLVHHTYRNTSIDRPLSS